ncbi:MAG: SH3 domain-containing protein [Campylobacteraceae bacterium]|nr:SH3 domain-containing protein [Campylobacteraceae bacterium]
MKNIILFLVSILFVNCAIKETKVIGYKQDITPFIKNIKPLKDGIEKFNFNYFSPWYAKSIQIKKNDASWANIVFLKDKKFFSENTLPWNLKDISPIINSTNFEDFNTSNTYAITSKNEQIRNLPTNKPFFRNFKEAGEGYPFDYLQNSRIHINTPLLISHYNKDGSWAFIQNPFSFGWIHTNNIAIINAKQREKFRNDKKIIIIKDKTPIYTKHQKFFTNANLGAIFPYTKEDDQFYYSYAFVNDFNKNSMIVYLMISKDLAKKFPLSFDSKNIKNSITKLLGQKYGWGGYLGNRDCSAMTKDFFSLFGIWLPRNSEAQKNAGKYISLKGKSNEEKEKVILESAIPFKTIIYLKGHIMLYIGMKQGKAIALHNLWGIRTKTNGKIGRYVIGKAIISDLYLGKNLNNIKAKSLLISRIQGITILGK